MTNSVKNSQTSKTKKQSDADATHPTGQLVYGAGGQTTLAFPARTLEHLKIVFATKLRRGESFLFSWDEDGNRHSLWLHPAIPLHFIIPVKQHGETNRHWLAELAQNAASNTGLHLTEEPAPGEETVTATLEQAL